MPQVEIRYIQMKKAGHCSGIHLCGSQKHERGLGRAALLKTAARGAATVYLFGSCCAIAGSGAWALVVFALGAALMPL